MYCTVSFTSRSKSKDAHLEKCGATELHLSAVQNFLSLDSLYEMCTMSSVVIKFYAVDIYKYLYGLLVASNKTDFAASSNGFSATEMLPLKSFSSAATIDFYALWYSRRDANLLYVFPFVCRHVSRQFSLERFPCNFVLKIAFKYLNLVRNM